MSRWTKLGREVLSKHKVFSVVADRLRREDDGLECEIHLFETGEWCNVVALTEDEHFVLVRQWRFGIEGESLEFPGGVVDPGESPLEAAARELGEETGYVARSIESLGFVRANPAMQATRHHMFVATGCTPRAGGQSLDALEDCRVEVLDRAQLERAIDEGTFNHALCWTALLAFDRWARNAGAAR
jgi:ADP-ribose pyrophosphatase